MTNSSSPSPLSLISCFLYQQPLQEGTKINHQSIPCIELPSGRNLQKCINKALREHSLTPKYYVNPKNVIFPNSPGTVQFQQRLLLIFLQRHIPKSPTVPLRFNVFYESFRDYIEKDCRIFRLQSSIVPDDEERKVWKITMQSLHGPLIGEAYDVIHISWKQCFYIQSIWLWTGRKWNPPSTKTAINYSTNYCTTSTLSVPSKAKPKDSKTPYSV